MPTSSQVTTISTLSVVGCKRKLATLPGYLESIPVLHDKSLHDQRQSKRCRTQYSSATSTPSITAYSAPNISTPPSEPSNLGDINAPEDAISTVSSHHWSASNLSTGQSSPTHNGPCIADSGDVLDTPELWDALSSILDDDLDESWSDSANRFRYSSDNDVIEWTQLDKLMATHEYGAWSDRMPTTSHVTNK